MSHPGLRRLIQGLEASAPPDPGHSRQVQQQARKRTRTRNLVCVCVCVCVCVKIKVFLCWLCPLETILRRDTRNSLIIGPKMLRPCLVSPRRKTDESCSADTRRFFWQQTRQRKYVHLRLRLRNLLNLPDGKYTRPAVPMADSGLRSPSPNRLCPKNLS